MPPAREELVSKLGHYNRIITDQKERLARTTGERGETLEALGALLCPLVVGQRISFEVRKRGGYPVRYGAERRPDRWERQTWELESVRASESRNYAISGSRDELHWRGVFVRIKKDGERGSSRQVVGGLPDHLPAAPTECATRGMEAVDR